EELLPLPARYHVRHPGGDARRYARGLAGTGRARPGVRPLRPRLVADAPATDPGGGRRRGTWASQSALLAVDLQVHELQRWLRHLRVGRRVLPVLQGRRRGRDGEEPVAGEGRGETAVAPCWRVGARALRAGRAVPGRLPRRPGAGPVRL